jgi:2-oxoglutarate ferredoxin oxidoreductase subunit gamma
MLLDRGLVHSRPACRYLEVPATDDARSVLKKVIVANIVMLGALVTATGVVSREAIEKAVLDSVPKGTEDLNLRALRQGYALGEEAFHEAA